MFSRRFAVATTRCFAGVSFRPRHLSTLNAESGSRTDASSNEKSDSTESMRPPQNEDPSEDDDAAGQREVEEYVPLLAFQSPWPYLSAAEEELSMISAGEHWPWKANLAYRIQEKNVEFRCPPSFTVLDEQTPRGDQLEEVLSRPVKTQLDLAAVARVASVAEKDAMLWLFKLHMEGKEPPEDKVLSSDSAASILSSTEHMLKRIERWTAEGDDDLSDVSAGLFAWHRALQKQLLGNVSRRRHALILLASVGTAKDVVSGESAAEILRATSDVLQRQEDEVELLDVAELLPALEALATLRQHGSEETCRAASEVLALLGKGPSLVQLLLSRSDLRKGQALRLLGALAFFPELLGSERSGSCSPCVALCLARLSGVRYGRDAAVDQETAAAAAFTLSRCGAWTSGSGNFLLMQALRRDLEAVEAEGDEPRPRQILDAERVSGVAGSWWLAAVAMSGLELEAAAGKPEDYAQRAPDALTEAITDLADTQGEGPASIAAQARSLWALHALGKAAEKEELAKKLFEGLQIVEPESFNWETLQLLRDLQPILLEENEECPFSTRWKEKLAASAQAEGEAFRASSRKDQLLLALKELPDIEEPELGFIAGPLCLSAFWKSRNLAIDIDAHYNVVSPVLRRQQWSKVAPEVEVKEIFLAAWDKEAGSHRLQLLREILGEEVAVEE